VKCSHARHVAMIVLLLLAVLLCPGCSFINDMVVINASGDTLKVTYRARERVNAAPRTKPASEVFETVAWQPLPDTRYKTDPDTHLTVLTLNHGEALLLTQCSPGNGQPDNGCTPEDFRIDEIVLVGANGEIKLTGDEARTAFSLKSKHVFTLTYY
jgi:hypothetical protein